MSRLTPALAEDFARMALGHVTREYPNKLDQVLTGEADLAGPRALHPIFYGSFDWHSAVHSHWLLARLLRLQPQGAAAPAIRARLDEAFTLENVAGELNFLARPAARGFERPYGWAWLLALQAELERAGTNDGRRWAATLRPLAGAFVQRFQGWLPKASYPVRSGVHSSSAFAFILALDYAEAVRDGALLEALKTTAAGWFAGDADAQAWEPSGADFLSATLVEAECMRRVLPAARFAAWFARFLPRLAEGQPQSLFEPARVSDRSDGQIAHLDGLNLSRAWCWRALAPFAPEAAQDRVLQAAERHLEAGLPHLDADYMGEHWLATYALLALEGLGG
ncbi:DUF2891 domain-containing protein [Caulobacter sp. KR2-114]|uniref:DUF2891 domain-containing protein n=1 Tax=Caulobacter sp. KR2-114 TaxID=3400912 RepID=UPI003C09E2DA